VISLQRGPVDPKFQVEGVAPTNHSSSQKIRLNDLSYGIKIWTDFSSILSQSTHLTDGQTAFSSLYHVCIACSAVKTDKFFAWNETVNKCWDMREMIMKTMNCHAWYVRQKVRAQWRGVARPLAAWCGGQICRPIVLGFGKWIACLKPGVLMPKVTCNAYSLSYSILVSS